MFGRGFGLCQCSSDRFISMKRKSSIYSTEMRVFPYLLILPNFLIFFIFIIIPFIYGLGLSFTDWKGIGSPTFTGLANYIDIFKDADYWNSILRTFKYAVIYLPIAIIFPLFLAYQLVKNSKLKGIYRTIFYWPSMISYIVVGIGFRFIFGDSTGCINYFIELIGLPKASIMTNSTGAFIVLILASLWSGTGGSMIIFMAGLENISTTYYEAAEVDGATPFQRFIHITIPLLKPTLFLVLITGIIGVFKTYGMVSVLTRGGPGDATKFVVQNIYDTAFSKFKLGYACTQSFILTFILAVFTIFQFKINKGGAIND